MLGFLIISPILFTVNISPSKDNLLFSEGIKVFKTPVILNSVLFDKLPFSYPNILSFSIISSPKLIPLSWIPEQFRNWLTVLLVYVMFVERPEIIVPVVPNPTVESTVITLDPLLTLSITFVLPVTSKVPVINSSSSKPTNKSKIK